MQVQYEDCSFYKAARQGGLTENDQGMKRRRRVAASASSPTELAINQDDGLSMLP